MRQPTNGDWPEALLVIGNRRRQPPSPETLPARAEHPHSTSLPRPTQGNGDNVITEIAETPSRPPSDSRPHLPPPTPEIVAPPRVFPPLLFECAWEVCRPAGGISTVLRTKVPAMIERWGDRYCLVGPYDPSAAAIEFEEQPTYGAFRETLQSLRDAGMNCHFGRWLIPGRPQVILLDFRARYPSLDQDKHTLWKDHGTDTTSAGPQVNDATAFGFAATEFFRTLTDCLRDRAVLAHFHGWTAGVAVARIAHLRLPVGSVFTTHATVLGSRLAAEDPRFYDHLPDLDPDAEADRHHVRAAHQIERAAARAATVFTTVGEPTSAEADKLLGRAPDGILPNGLNIHRFAAPHEFQHLHQLYKERIHQFVAAQFFPSYTFDLDDTLYLFISGRYAYRGKGIDLFIEAMYRLNAALKQISNPPTVVAFVITRAAVRNVNVDVLRNQSMFEDLRQTCAELQEQMSDNLFRAVARSRGMPTYAELVPDDAQVRLRRALHARRSGRLPAVVAHDLIDDAHDPVLCHLRHRELFNRADDPVKIVFHPQFLNATGPLINLEYEQFVRGCHMGVFPGYHEPWGHCAMECVALGVPAVTTDLSGFGAHVLRHVPGSHKRGIPAVAVIDRRTATFDDATGQLVGHLLRFLQLQRRERIELRNRVERLGELFDWSLIARHYEDAHALALERMGAPRPGNLEVRLV